MIKEIIKKEYPNKGDRIYLIYDIIKEDNISITDIVSIKERAMQEDLLEKNSLLSGLAFRATCIFGDTPKNILKNIEQVKELIAEDIIKSGVIKDTPFEKKLVKLTNPPLVS